MARKYHIGRQARGFTLIEVLMTVVIIGILATVALRSVHIGVENSRVRETQNEMGELVQAIGGNPDLYDNGMRNDFGYIGDIGALPATLDNLITNPGGLATWNGPYISRRFAQDTDGFKKDAWGNAYTFSGGITISSTGGGSTPMTTSVAATATDLTSTSVTGTITDAAGNPPGDSSIAVTIRITYPDGSGSTTTSTANPNSGGLFSFTGIPIGIRTVEGIYRATNDTATVFACVLPKNGAMVNLRLPSDPFAASGGGGGAGGSGIIEYVNGSAQTTGADNNEIQFNVTNTGTAAVTVTSLTPTYTPSVYFRRIRWDAGNVFNETNPRAGSGDVCTFNSSKILNAGQTIAIELEEFDDAPTGGNNADVSNTDFTITFSDGSVITFNSGT